LSGHRKTPRWIIPALGALVLLSLGVSLGGEFVWDDRPLIVENVLVKNADRLDEMLTRGFWESDDNHDRFRAFYRPLISLSYFVDHAIWGPKPFGFHLTNLLLHFACCLLVLRLGLDERLDPRAAFAGAALFAVHPVHVESVAWISGRTDLIASAFVFGAFVCHTRRANGRSFRLASWLLFAAALYSKEVAATFPAIVFASNWLKGQGRGRLRGALAAAAPFFAILGVYMISRSSALGGAGEPAYTLEPVAWIATGIFVVGRYITLLLLPLGLDAHYPYSTFETLIDPRVMVAAVILVVLGFAAWRLARAKSPALLWFVWVGLTLTPMLAFGYFGDVLLADRFLYLPSAGAALLAAYGVHAAIRLERSQARLVSAAVGLALVVLGAMAASRSRVWVDDHRLFTKMLETSPNSALVHNNLGLALYQREDLPGAVDRFRSATELAPEYALAHNNLAAALHRTGRKQEALSHYRQALAFAPGLVIAAANAGHLLVESGSTDEGLALLRKTADRHPHAPVVLYALADALYLIGDSDGALVWLDRIRTVDPDYPERFYLLGKIYFQADRLDQAAEEMTRFLELRGGVGMRADFARDVVRRARTRAAS